MKTFITRICFLITAFCFVFFAGYGLMCLFLHRVGDFSINPTNSDVFVGHSEIACGLDDAALVHGQNIAKGGEGYLYTYLKLQNVLKQNTHVSRVFIVFSNNLAYKKLDRWIWDDNHLNEFGVDWCPFFSAQELKLVLNKNPLSVISVSGLAIKKQITRIANSNYNYLDSSVAGYFPKRKSIVDSLIALDKVHQLRNFKNDNIAASLFYLHEMIALCQEKGIEVYLFRAPLHEAYEGFLYEERFQQLRKEEFTNVPFLDFGHLPFDNEEFADFNHLSEKGATRFSLFLNEIMQSDQLNKYIINE